MSSTPPATVGQPVPLFMSEIEAMGGAERSILALGRWLHRHGRPAYLLTFRDRLGLPAHADFPLPVCELARQGGMLRKLAALREHLRRSQGHDAAMLTSGYQPALYASLVPSARFHCLMHDTPSLFRPWNERTWPERLRVALSNRIIGRGIRRGGGHMVVTSNYLQRECRNDFGVDALIARMGGLGGAHTFRRRPLAGKLQMLSVSRMESNKRIDWMLDALAALEQAPVPLSSRVDWQLTLAGKGAQLGALQQRSAQLGLAQRIQFPGFISDTELEARYAETHLFLMPAVQGYGIPAIEALQRGIPVLLSRDSGVSDILLHTPWAAVIESKAELQPRLEEILAWLLAGHQMTTPSPENLPTEDSWAERVATICGYI